MKRTISSEIEVTGCLKTQLNQKKAREREGGAM